MTFIKDPGDETFNRQPFIGLNFIGAMFAALGIGVDVPQVERERWRRGKRPQQKRHKKRNMLVMSKRVRRKHRRARA